MDLMSMAQLVGNIGEFVGAIAVVATLFYLAVQIRHSKDATEANTRSIRGRAAWDAEVVWADRNERVAKDPGHAAIVQRIFDTSCTVDSFDQGEQAQVFAEILSILQRVRAQYFLWREGVLADEIWAYRSVWARRYITLPVVSAIWEDLKLEDLLSPVFVDVIDRIPASSAATLSIASRNRA